MSKKSPVSFGEALRDARMKKNISLRKFAKAVDVSPTYLSQVEQDKMQPPTADRVKRMAEELGENPDEWIALAGRVPGDLPKIIQAQSIAVPDLLRAVEGMTADQLRKLRDTAERMKKKG